MLPLIGDRAILFTAEKNANTISQEIGKELNSAIKDYQIDRDRREPKDTAYLFLQFNNRDRIPAAILRFIANGFNQRMRS